jgi:cell division protein ZapE
MSEKNKVEAAYQAKLASGELKPDMAQARVVQHLQNLASELANAAAAKANILSRLFRKPAAQPMGCYIHGAVGRGKTMLMDLFFESISDVPKRRIHFHAFMQEVHALRGQQKSIETIADEISQTVKLLCLDEMQIVDIADAMIVGRLYEAMQQRGVVMVTTANLPPNDLYTDGLNRDLFLPFVARLNSSLDVISLDSRIDYRLGRMKSRETYLHPNVEWQQDAFAAIWNDLTDGAKGEDTTLDVLGRKLVIPAQAHGCAAFAFDDLCRDALGPADYLAIAKAYRTVFVHVVPALKAHERNETKRFILMIDTFYDAGTRLVALADVPPEKICPKNQHAKEFARTLSRLHEMQSASWWQTSDPPG